MSEAIRLLIADDHALFRRGLAELLAESREVDLVGEARDGREAVSMAIELKPDVVLLDVHMPNFGGVEAAHRLKEALPVRILMLTISDKDEDLLAAIDAGADGYLLKNAEPEALFSAIQHVAEGRAVLSPEVTSQVLRRVGEADPRPVTQGLTPRETQVLRLLAKGSTTAQMAQSLGVASSTIKTHVHNILRKMEASNRAQAVAKAAARGLLE